MSDNDDTGSDGPLEDNPIWIQEHVSLLSVGIDNGSSGTRPCASDGEIVRGAAGTLRGA